MAEPRKLLVAAAAGIAGGYTALLLFTQHQWLLDAAGHPQVTDFLAPKAAGALAWSGHAISAYNDGLQHVAEEKIIGHSFTSALGWPYPPHYFFLVAPLSLLSFVQAFLLWSTVTLAGYAAAVACIAQRREAAVLAIAAPSTLACVMVGQNGFLTAALLGMALLFLKRRPVLSAVLICVLTYKPQFGLLLPIALIAGGYWRATDLATAMMALLLSAAGLVFGFDTFSAFWAGLPATTHHLVEQGSVGWGKLQSVYGFARWLGTSNNAAWIAQGVLALTLAGAIARLWRSKASAAVKAAGLAVATLLATPYVFLYDQPLLAVAIAFLCRERKLTRMEIGAITFSLLAFIASAFLVAPLAWLGSLLLLAVVGRQEWKRSPAEIIRGAS